MPEPVMRTKYRYYVNPGWVISADDGDRHYVGVRALIALYGVDPSECLTDSELSRRNVNTTGMITLTPRRDGRYRLPDGSPRF